MVMILAPFTSSQALRHQIRIFQTGHHVSKRDLIHGIRWHPEGLRWGARPDGTKTRHRKMSRRTMSRARSPPPEPSSRDAGAGAAGGASEADGHVLHVDVLLHRVVAAFASEAGRLHAAERRLSG